jgi:hypothetical protein
MNRGITYDTALETFAVATAPFNVAAATTDFFCLVGSPTKTVIVLEVSFLLTQTAASGITVFFIKRSADNTGGTFTNPTIVPADSQNTASGAVVRAYTVNPAALGATVGNFYATTVQAPVATGAIANSPNWYQRQQGEQGITLRGINEVLSFNLAGATFAGLAAKVVIRWVEI